MGPESDGGGAPDRGITSRRAHSVSVGKLMPHRRLLAPLCWLMLLPATAAAQHDSATIRDTALARQLIEHGKADQGIRDTLVKRLQAGHPPDSALVAQMHLVDSTDTAWLKRSLARSGWPTVAAVGREGAEAAFLIVQHADADTAFQAYALPLLRQAAARHQAPGEWVALLADRLAVARGQPQEYGTQAKIENDRVTFRPIADSAHVDQRRAKLGLMPLAEYKRLLDSMYTTQSRPAPDSSR